MLEISETGFGDALKEAMQVGQQLEKERIVHALSNDAVITTNLPAQWVEYLVGIVENV
jgi:hypothetical protein